MAANDELIEVEVAYARPDTQVLIALRVPPGTLVSDAIEQSGVLKDFPEIDLEGANKVGIFGKLTRLNTALQAGDRVEIYRELIADPREARRARAADRSRPKRAAGRRAEGKEADTPGRSAAPPPEPAPATSQPAAAEKPSPPRSEKAGRSEAPQEADLSETAGKPGAAEPDPKDRPAPPKPAGAE